MCRELPEGDLGRDGCRSMGMLVRFFCQFWPLHKGADWHDVRRRRGVRADR